MPDIVEEAGQGSFPASDAPAWTVGVARPEVGSSHGPGERTPVSRWPVPATVGWAETCTTLHMWSQVVGKTRLALAPMLNHWWHVALYVSVRGLTTSPIPYGDRLFEVEFDLHEHALKVETDDGARWSTALAPRSVADFYSEYMEGLRSLGVEVRIWPHPVEVPETIPFPEDETLRVYDEDAATSLWRVLLHVDCVLNRFRGRFRGKCSPVHFFWGGFDLACTRFSGRPAPDHPGGIPNLPDWVTREAYSHECISAGWWPGTVGGAVSEPSFYAYAYPEPPGCPEARILPDGGRYELALREWVLPYEAVRTASDPEAELLAFLQSTYDAAAELGRWPRVPLDVAW